MKETFNIEEIEKECGRIFDSAALAQIKTLEAHGPMFNIMQDGKIIDKIYDVCGDSSIQFSNKTTSFCNQLRKYNKARNLPPYTINFPRTINRQEWSVNKAGYEAVASVLSKYCSGVYVNSWVD